MQKKPLWVKTGTNNAATQKALRDAILNRPELQIALAKYINSLNLQGQVNKGLITEHQALTLFTQAVQNFKKQVNIEINNCFTANQLDENDLSNPFNMQNALNSPNPDSFLIQLLDNAAADIILSIQTDMELEQTQQQATQEEQQAEDVQAAQEQQQEILQPTPRPHAHEEEQLPAQVAETVLKGVAITEAIKVLDDKPAIKEAEKLLEKTFHHLTGMEGSFEKAVEEKLSKDDSLSSIPVPRPPKDTDV